MPESYVVPIPAHADNPRYGLTLRELLAWAVAAQQDGADVDAPLAVSVNIGGRARSLRLVTGPELDKLRSKHRRDT